MTYQNLTQAEIRAAIFNSATKKQKTGARKHRNNPEEQLHMLCQQWNELQTNDSNNLKWMFHSPNGGSRTTAEAGKLKAMGVKSGVPDFMLPYPSPHYKGLAIELKSPKNTCTLDQKRWLQKSMQEGWVVGVARTFEEYMFLYECYWQNSGDFKQAKWFQLIF